jgi:U3 small nucleolar RNA-associated protein 14
LRNRRRKTTQPDEESDEVAPSDPDGEEEEMTGMIDLSTMLDVQAQSDEESDSEGGDGEPTPDDHRVSDEEQLMPSDGEDENEQSAALDALGDFIGGLETTYGSKKRKADKLELEPSAAERAPRKRRIIQERTEGGAEGEFASTAMGM